jgi:hypothetical protein
MLSHAFAQKSKDETLEYTQAFGMVGNLFACPAHVLLHLLFNE